MFDWVLNMKLQCLFCWGKLLSLLPFDFVNKRNCSQLMSLAQKLFTKIFVARMKYFSNRFILFSSTLSSAQLNLVKVSVMYVLSYVFMYVLRMAHTFNQVLFDMPKKWGCNIFFANNNRIALNFTVHWNEYNSTNKIMCQQLTFKKWVQSNVVSVVP